MGATSTGVPKRTRRVKRDFAVFPTFLQGTCDLCRGQELRVNEVRLPDHYRHYRWWVVCDRCLDVDRRLLAARSVIQSALRVQVA